jgi:sugar lactone lactonase YvrE
MSEIEHLLPIHNTLGEGSLWSVAEQALYWVDIHNNCYHRLTTSSGAYETIPVGIKIGVLAQRASGGLVMATQQGFAFWDDQKKELKFLNNPGAQKPSMRFNDGAVDCRGRFWAGTMSDNGTIQQKVLFIVLIPMAQFTAW